MLGNWRGVPVVAAGGVALGVALMVAMISYLKPQVEVQEPMPVATAAVVDAVEVSTGEPTTALESVMEEPSVSEVWCEPFIVNQYMQFNQPTTNAAAFVHEQEADGDLVAEKYYMMLSGEKKLLYQVDFGKEKEGNWLGLLELDTVEVPVSYTIYAIPDEELAVMNETERQHYSELMSGLGTVLDSIMNDSRFRADKPLSTGEKKSVNLTYWSLELPSDMSWTETEENGEYQSIFYGKVKDEQVPLYNVRIGEVEAQTVLGQYRVNGTEKKVSVESFDLPQREDWTEEDYSTAYRMMSTINDLIQVIDASADFTAE